MPSPKPARRLPVTLPMPPSTTTTKVRMTSSKPMLVRIGLRGATRPAARATAAHSKTKTPI